MKRIFQTMKEEFSTLDTTDHTLKKFGLLIGGIILLIAGVLGVVFDKELHIIMPILGFLLVGLGLAAPQFLKYPYYAWMGIAIVLGYFIGNLLLFMLFFVFLTPIALLRAMFSKRVSRTSESYWLPREKTWTKESMEKLF